MRCYWKRIISQIYFCRFDEASSTPERTAITSHISLVRDRCCCCCSELSEFPISRGLMDRGKVVYHKVWRRLCNWLLGCCKPYICGKYHIYVHVHQLQFNLPFMRMQIQGGDSTIIGRVSRLLAPTTSRTAAAIAILEIFEVATARHPIWKMPYLFRRDGRTTYQIVQAAVSIFA